jgi:hypothetical protein
MAIRRGSVVIDLTSDDSSDDDSQPIIPELHTPKTASTVFTSPEGALFLNDLSNYLPVGTLVLSEVSDFEAVWEEVHDIVNLSGLSKRNKLDLEKLLTRRRLRLFVSLPSKSILRVYLLPNDVGKGFGFTQQDRGLDGHLFSLFRDIDISLNHPKSKSLSTYTQPEKKVLCISCSTISRLQTQHRSGSLATFIKKVCLTFWILGINYLVSKQCSIHINAGPQL